jgi:hypothetical protein
MIHLIVLFGAGSVLFVLPVALILNHWIFKSHLQTIQYQNRVKVAANALKASLAPTAEHLWWKSCATNTLTNLWKLDTSAARLLLGQLAVSPQKYKTEDDYVKAVITAAFAMRKKYK